MFSFLKHWFTPHSGNNHRAKILHHSSIFAFIIILSISFFFANIFSFSRPDVLGISYSISQSDLLTLVNQKRSENGLAPLQENPELEDAARRKATDMFSKNYWAHFAPDGSTSPWEFIRASGYNYQFAGENLAKGFTDSSSIVSAWMSSPSHRQNLLSDKYKDIGFAVVEGDLQGEETVLVVQMFGSTTSPTLAGLSEIASSSVPVAQEAQIQGETKKTTASSPEEVVKKPVVDVGKASKAASSAALTFLAFGFLLDMVIIERRRIPRIAGHNLDHIMLISVFIFFIIIMKGGVIL